MHIAITGATGFLGRYLVHRLAGAGNGLRCWHRPESNLSGFDLPPDQLHWEPGQLDEPGAAERLVAGCDAVVHAALWRPGSTFRGGGGDVARFAEVNVVGTLRLIQAARAAGAKRFVFISTCAVHEQILDDRPLDETHPLWPQSHYGAHKAAIEKFVHSYGLGEGYEICALRPTGIYGLAHPAQDSKWFSLVRSVVRSEPVVCRNGGKEVHAEDVARAAEILLTARGIAGQAYNCYDLYISELDVAALAKQFSGSSARVAGEPRGPKHQIVTDKLRDLGMQFGGRRLLEESVRQLVQAAS